jgi:calcium-dependent protein kinase
LIDWGGARYFQKNKKLNKISGTPYYIAPEVLDEKYDEKCDVWSCGVILYILLCGYPPFNGDSDIEIMKTVKKGKFEFPIEEWGSISKEGKELVANMLKYDPKARFSAEDCLKHPWFKCIDGGDHKKQISANLINNMKKFGAGRKLEQATVSFIVTQLISKEERNELLSQFQTWDKNGDGVLSKEEIFEGYKALYGELKASEEADKIMESCDLDGNGTIDYNEFLAATMNRNKILSKTNLEAAFAAFDKDGSGKISADEIMMIFNKSGNLEDKARIQKIIDEADENGDGEISFDEFKVLMSKFF